MRGGMQGLLMHETSTDCLSAGLSAMIRSPDLIQTKHHKLSKLLHALRRGIPKQTAGLLEHHWLSHLSSLCSMPDMHMLLKGRLFEADTKQPERTNPPCPSIATANHSLAIELVISLCLSRSEHDSRMQGHDADLNMILVCKVRALTRRVRSAHHHRL